METLFSHFSDWDSTSLSLSSETCQRAGHLKADDRRPLVSQSVTKNQSAPRELRQETATDKEKMKNAVTCLVGNSMPHHPGQSPLPENRESKQGNAEARGTELCAAWAQPHHRPAGSGFEFVAKPALC